MAIWGVDLGVRSAYAACTGRVTSIELKPKKHSRSEELRLLHVWAQETFGPEDVVYVEEPPLAGRRNLRVFLHLAQTSGVIASACRATLVPVASWKKGTVGNGAASKDLVAEWLRTKHPSLHSACAGDQNLVDATCISLYAVLDQG